MSMRKGRMPVLVLVLGLELELSMVLSMPPRLAGNEERFVSRFVRI
jgi:hypothetical protein